DGSARLWSAPAGTDAVRTLPHPAPVRHASFHPDGRLLATACADGKVRRWDLTSGRPCEIIPASEAGVSFVTFSPDGRSLLIADDKDAARVLAGTTGEPRTPPLPHVRRLARLSGDKLGYDVAPAFSPDGRTVLTYQQGVHLWDAATGTELRHIEGNSN